MNSNEKLYLAFVITAAITNIIGSYYNDLYKWFVIISYTIGLLMVTIIIINSEMRWK